MARRVWEKRREDLRQLLKEVRQQAGLTQVKLAAKLPSGRSQSYLSKLERGEMKLDLADLEEILDVCKIDVVDFARRFRDMR